MHSKLLKIPSILPHLLRKTYSCWGITLWWCKIRVKNRLFSCLHSCSRARICLYNVQNFEIFLERRWNARMDWRKIPCEIQSYFWIESIYGSSSLVNNILNAWRYNIKWNLSLEQAITCHLYSNIRFWTPNGNHFFGSWSIPRRWRNTENGKAFNNILNEK